jgi:tyrosinase
MDTPLVPFSDENGTMYTSKDCVDIEEQLGYNYGPASLDEFVNATEPLARFTTIEPTKQVRVSGIDRSKISGSFIIAAYTQVNGSRLLVGADAVLSRWTVAGCANCQTRLRAGSQFQVASNNLDNSVEVVIHTRNGPIGNVPSTFQSAGQLRTLSTQVDVPFKVEVI